jgi:hypothetical protein
MDSLERASSVPVVGSNHGGRARLPTDLVKGRRIVFEEPSFRWPVIGKMRPPNFTQVQALAARWWPGGSPLS